MSLFHVIAIVIPLGMAIAVPKFLPSNHERAYRPLLYAACALFFISWCLPSPLIDGQDTSFTTHFVGGGMFTGLLWLYGKKSLGWKAHWLLEALSLFALVSALGCINELAELFMVRAHIATILLSDTNWDILANTLGALAVFILYLIVHNLKPLVHDRRH